MINYLVILQLLAISLGDYYIYPEFTQEAKNHYNAYVQQEETLIVSIQENPSTGFMWIIHQQTSNLQITQNWIQLFEEECCGYPVQTEFHITCKENCNEEFISFVYARPFEYNNFVQDNKQLKAEEIMCAIWSFEVHIMYTKPEAPLFNTFIEL